MRSKRPPREVLESLVAELLTQQQIAGRYGVAQVTVSRWLRHYGIEALGKTGKIDRELPPLTAIQQALVVGSLLGDGTMSAPSFRTARIAEGHALKQREYTDWKAGIMGSYVSNQYEATKRKDGKTYKAWWYSSRTTTRLRPFYDMFYGSGHKVFPKQLPELMTPFVLAVWYMDDGSRWGRYYPRISYGLDAQGLDRALEALAMLGLSPKVYTSKKGRTLHFPGQDDLFFSLVREHVHSCMVYKLPLERVRKRYVFVAERQDRRPEFISALTPERLRKMYEGDLMTDGEIAVCVAKRFGVSPFRAETVRRVRKKWGIPAMTSQERKERRRGTAPRLTGLTRKVLERLYVEDLLSDTEIGRIYGVSKTPIRARRRAYGILAISKAERARLRLG